MHELRPARAGKLQWVPAEAYEKGELSRPVAVQPRAIKKALDRLVPSELADL